MNIYCPYCKENVEYGIEKRKIEKFRNVKVDTYENVGVCKKCGNDLYINSLEEKNTQRLYEKYRENSDIIKPEEIIKLRVKYDISQRELTSILDFGKMTINRYENGGLPTKSQSDYLKLLIENKEIFIEKVKEAYNNGRITHRTYNKIINNTSSNNVIKEDFDTIIRKYIEYSLSRKPDIYNGYKDFDLERVENIISYIASKVNNLTITSMNKYLWFIDIISFSERGLSITGITYQKQQFGPTIDEFKYNEISNLDDKYQKIDIEDSNGNINSIIKSKNNFDLSDLKDSEKEIIDRVIKKLKNKKVSEISEISHKQKLWKDTKKMNKIPFEYCEKIDLK